MVSVVMVDDRFEPGGLAFQAGQPTGPRLASHGPKVHEFTAADVFHAAPLRDPRRLATAGTEVVVQPE
jgi:hypothetical protein